MRLIYLMVQYHLIGQVRAGKLWTQIESTFKQMDTAGTELECFQALQKQEKLAALHRINSLYEEVNRQKELERSLQHRYGNLLVEQERIQMLLEEYMLELQKQEEIAAKNRELEALVPTTEENGPVPSSEELPISIPTDQRHEETPTQEADASQEEAAHNADICPSDMNVDQDQIPVVDMDMCPSSNTTGAAVEEKATQVAGDTHVELNVTGDQICVMDMNNSNVSSFERSSIPSQAANVDIGAEISNLVSTEEKMMVDSVDHPAAGDSGNGSEVATEDKEKVMAVDDSGDRPPSYSGNGAQAVEERPCDSGTQIEGETTVVVTSDNFVKAAKSEVEYHGTITAGQNLDDNQIEPVDAADGVVTSEEGKMNVDLGHQTQMAVNASVNEDGTV